jgi:hypothetical protein
MRNETRYNNAVKKLTPHLKTLLKDLPTEELQKIGLQRDPVQVAKDMSREERHKTLHKMILHVLIELPEALYIAFLEEVKKERDSSTEGIRDEFEGW